MPPINRGKSSGNPKCPVCGSHFKYLEAHITRIHRTTLSEDASEQLAQENTTNSADYLTPNLSQEPISISDENFILDNQISRIVFTHSTFNKYTFNFPN
ncbi:2536_t:CDS:2 [Dentiscutata erythropus]|uniref:2536_t:CDS:1 n=1 Tax=Dentiscutata erythropus TaxID=1348616 RepID=A0A9N9G9J1_9GLOM|nr:2536_t:CDS:2 [Dentiscutata erythropus]